MFLCVCVLCVCVCVCVCWIMVCLCMHGPLVFHTHSQNDAYCTQLLMSGKTPLLMSLMQSLRAEMVPMAQQEPQSGRQERKPILANCDLPHNRMCNPFVQFANVYRLCRELVVWARSQEQLLHHSPFSPATPFPCGQISKSSAWFFPSCSATDRFKRFHKILCLLGQLLPILLEADKLLGGSFWLALLDILQCSTHCSNTVPPFFHQSHSVSCPR